jgi:hypothetical protein
VGGTRSHAGGGRAQARFTTAIAETHACLLHHADPTKYVALPYLHHPLHTCIVTSANRKYTMKNRLRKPMYRLKEVAQQGRHQHTSK